MSDEIEDKDDPVVPPPTPTPKPAPPTEDVDAMTPEELREHLRKARKSLKQTNAEAQAGREAKRRLQELEEEEEKRKTASLSEQERLQRRTAELERVAREAETKAAKFQQQLVVARIDREVEDEARKQGAEIPRQVAEMLRGRQNNGIEYDPETDKVNGVKDAVKKLIGEYENLTRRSGMPVGRGTPPRDQAAGQRSQLDASQDDVEAMALKQTLRYGQF